MPMLSSIAKKTRHWRWDAIRESVLPLTGIHWQKVLTAPCVPRTVSSPFSAPYYKHWHSRSPDLWRLDSEPVVELSPVLNTLLANVFSDIVRWVHELM